MLATEKQNPVQSKPQIAPPVSYSSVPIAVKLDTHSLLQGGRDYVKPNPAEVETYLEGDDYKDFESGYYGGGVGGKHALAIQGLEEMTPFIDLSNPNRSGMNPMTYAAKENYLAGLKWFAENDNPNFRLNPFLAESDGRTALHAGARSGSVEVVEYLLNFAVDDFRAKGQYANLSDKEIKRQLLELPDKKGNTCLRYACGNDKLEMIKHLINNYDVDVSVTNQAGETPFTASFLYPKTLRITGFFMAKPYNKHLTQPEYPKNHHLTPLHSHPGHLEESRFITFLERVFNYSIDLYSTVTNQMLETKDTMALEKYSRAIKKHEARHAGNKAVKAAVQAAFHAHESMGNTLNI